MAKAGVLCSLLLVFALGCAPAQARPEAAHTVLISDTLVALLDAVADTATIEHYRCLLGAQRGDTLGVAHAWEPHILHADYNTVTAAGCPPFTVGTWHNHLPYNIPMNDPHNRATRVDPASVCELSPADRLASAREPWSFSMISVARGIHCAWQRAVVRDTVYFQRLPWVLP